MTEAPGARPPALRRLEVGAALRRHRKTAQLTTAEVIQRLGISASKLSRIETGNRSVQVADLYRLCELYGVDADERTRLMRFADESRQSSAWKNLDSLDFVNVEYLELEGAASAVDDYKSSTVTALLQTPDYTRALIRAFAPNTPADMVEEQVSARLRRQTDIFQRPAPPRLSFVLDEAVLRRTVGGLTTMRAQLHRIADLADHDSTTIQVIPFEAGAHLGMDSLFTILSFQEAVRDRVYVDGLLEPTYLETMKEIQRYRATFSSLRDLALDPEVTRQLVLTTAKSL